MRQHPPAQQPLQPPIRLLTIANGFHWFDFIKFYPLVHRILKSEGIFAAWAYGVPITQEQIDPVIAHFHNHTLHDFWVYKNRLVENEYKTIPFPFEEISCRAFISPRELDRAAWINSLNTCSPQQFIKKHGAHPTDPFIPNLQPTWGESSLKRIITRK